MTAHTKAEGEYITPQEIRAEAIRSFADTLANYYNRLGGKTSSALVAFHIRELAKEHLRKEEEQ